ncbi:DUF6119 family protein [Mucilaginibacter rubeus]|uniref:Sporadically distributed protein, TIGR04141 family n=1 Tax=Mucilaginibacter rubeus TaxID=2027860 RepID=A0A5C1I435_9SPHI|nr:DUF6119 family protein [Mucilaginibacter rubeus]QEM12596.1 hypothetical protein DEO27_022135 [Mucilaginibacter rubeus]
MNIFPNLYRIDKKHYRLRELHDTISVIKRIVKASISTELPSLEIDPDSVTEFPKDNVNYYLYTYNTDEIASDWVKFLPKELTGNKDFIQKKLSLTLFIETEFDLFVIVGGNAFKMVVSFIDHSFGLNYYDRIIEPDKDELTSIRTRGMTGQRIGMNEQFRNEYRIVNFTRFGKLPKEIHVKLCRETTNTHFPYLKRKVSDRVQITVGAGFKVSRPVDFETLHKLVIEMSIIKGIEPSDYLSSFVEIKDENVLKDCRWMLVRKIYDNLAFLYENGHDPRDRFDFDFCNPNKIDKYYEADTYQLKEKTEGGGFKIFDTIADREDVFKRVMDRAMELELTSNIYDFNKYIWGVHITAVKGEKGIANSGFIFHFSAEFSMDGKAIFLIDTKWYILKDQFIKDMVANATHILKTYAAPATIFKYSWDRNTTPREKDYNLKYDGLPGYIVMDTVIVDGIELCDFVFYNEQTIYLVHVKAGFSSPMRELANQITISARRLREALNTDENPFLDRLYQRLLDKGFYLNDLDLTGFKALFKKTINYVLAVNSTLSEDLLIEENMNRYDSNIARFSLIQCSNEMNTSYYPLLTYQIPRY